MTRVSHKNRCHVHRSALEQLASEELQNLFNSKDTLDQDFPGSVKHLSHDDMWKIACRSLLDRLCDPNSRVDEY